MDEKHGAAATPVARDPAFASALREVFTRAGYTEERLRELQGSDEQTPDGRPNVAFYRRRLGHASPLDTLVRLFVLNVAVSGQEARAAFSPLGLDAVSASGLVRVTPDGGEAHSPFAVSATSGLLLAHDPSGTGFHGIRADHVAGVGASSLAVAAATPRRPNARALDLGSGAGIHALLAAGHSEEVVAVDANPRALAFTAFNAALGGAEVTTRLGDWYEPVAGERFDLIACNPPYVISPDTRYQFRDGGMPEDRLCEAVVHHAAEHLTEDGFAVVLCNWAHHGSDEWWEPAARWVDGLGCDAWLLHDESLDPLTYAAVWNRGLPEPAYGEALDRWTAYFSACGITAVTAGVVLVRRRSAARNWLRTTTPARLSEPLGDQVDRIVAAEDLLGRGDEAVLHTRLRLPPDHRLEFGMRAGEGRISVQETRLRLVRGLRSEIAPDDEVLFVLARCDGQHTVAEIAGELASAKGVTHDSGTAAVLAVARRLLELGLLTDC